VIALLSWIGHTVTAKLGTVDGAPNVAVDDVLRSVWVQEFHTVALFTQIRIDDTVTTTREKTIGTTTRIGFIRVQWSVVALLSDIDDSITASGRAGGGAGVCVVCSVIALLVEIGDVVTTVRESTVGTTLTRIVSHEGTVVALFSVVHHTVTAVGQPAVGTASVGRGVAVERTIIALFES